MLSANVGVCEGESALWQSLQCTAHSLSFSHTYTHSLYCNVNLSSHTFAFIWQKSCWVHYCSCWHRWERCQHTHTTHCHLPLLSWNGSSENLCLKIKFGRGHYDIWICVCVQISVRWSCVSWLTCQLTHSCWESFRTLKQTPSPCWQLSGG